MDRIEIVREELESLFQSSRQVALEDGIISDDENKLLSKLQSYFNELEEELKPMMQFLDEMSEEDLRKRTKLVAQEVIPKLTQEAKKDDVITEEESNIISELIETIMNSD